MTYLDTLARELELAGVRGRRRDRIMAEFTDHLRCDPEADLGAPRDLARQFADELGTGRARRAGLAAFASLAVAGVLYAVAFLTQAWGPNSTLASTPPLGDLGGVLVILAPQVAFVAGALAAARSWRLRKQAVVSRAEATIIVRRAAVGLGAGMASMVGFVLLAIALRHQAAGWWVVLTLSLAGAGSVALLASAPAVLSAARLRPVGAGTAGDLFDDLGRFVPSALRDRPWRFALAVAGGVALAVTAAGVLASDPFDGALRGLADASACLLGFAVLGRYLGLRN